MTSQEQVPAGTVEQIADVSVPKTVDETAKVIQMVPQERFQERTSEKWSRKVQ